MIEHWDTLCFTFEPGEVVQLYGLTVRNLNAEAKTVTREMLYDIRLGEIRDGIQVSATLIEKPKQPRRAVEL